MEGTKARVESCSHAGIRAFSHVASGDAHTGLRVVSRFNFVGIVVPMCLVGVSLRLSGQSTWLHVQCNLHKVYKPPAPARGATEIDLRICIGIRPL